MSHYCYKPMHNIIVILIINTNTNTNTLSRLLIFILFRVVAPPTWFEFVMRVKIKTIRLLILTLTLLYKCLAAFTAVEIVRIVRRNYVNTKVCRVKLCQQILAEKPFISLQTKNCSKKQVEK